MVEHTRFVFTPTGPAHIGHAFMARINRELARRTGGTFVYRVEDILAAVAGAADWRHGRREVGQENVASLEALGLTASPPEELVAQSFEAASGLRWQSEHLEMTQFYWRQFGFARWFGPWPLPAIPGQNYERASVMIATHALHPFPTLHRVVEDYVTGRTAIVRGLDIMEESALYGTLSRMVGSGFLAAREPEQCYLPLVYKAGGKKLSSSDPQNTKPMFVRDVLEAGRTGEELFSWLDSKLLNPAAPTQPGLASPWELVSSLDSLNSLYRPDLRIDSDEWQIFLAGDEDG